MLSFETIFDAVAPADLGPVFLEYKNDPEGAIQRLLKEKTGDARSVVTRSGLGSIDIVYGSPKTGLAKIAIKHPEMLQKLAGLLRNGRIVRKPGAQKVFIVGEGDPADVAVIALDWYGAAKTWVVTSYVDDRGVFTGSLKTIDTETLDSAWMEVLYADQQTVGTLSKNNSSVNSILDDTGVPDVAAMMARMKLTSQLRGLKAQILALGKDPISMIKSARLAEQLRKIRKELGASTGITKPSVEKMARPEVTRFVIKRDITTEVEWQESMPSGWSRLTGFESLEAAKAAVASQGYDADSIPVLESQWNQKTKKFDPARPVSPHVTTLRAVVSGQHGSKGLPELYGLIQEAVNGLDEAGELTGEADAMANEAITHWAELEERLSAHV